jgi:hypothetical protein
MEKKQKIPLKGGAEYDTLTHARKFYVYLKRAGVAKGIKRQYNKRFRKLGKNPHHRREEEEDLAIYYCMGCDKRVDNDYFPMEESELCPPCHEEREEERAMEADGNKKLEVDDIGKPVFSGFTLGGGFGGGFGAAAADVSAKRDLFDEVMLGFDELKQERVESDGQIDG